MNIRVGATVYCPDHDTYVSHRRPSNYTIFQAEISAIMKTAEKFTSIYSQGSNVSQFGPFIFINAMFR